MLAIWKEIREINKGESVIKSAAFLLFGVLVFGVAALPLLWIDFITDPKRRQS